MQHPAPTVTATVAACLRVSSQAQRQSETIASQREAVLDHGRSLGWAIPDDLVFADDGFSGATLERPALDALRDGVARGEVETVPVWSIDRLSRNFAHQILLQEEFARSGATTRCVQEPDDATPHGMLLRQILSVISECERTQIAERSRRGRIHRARQGSLNMLARAPCGYRLIRKTETCGARFEIDETEARVVRRIFDLHVRDGLKMHQTARRLDEEGLHPRHSRHWPISTVAVILRNEARIGKAACLKTTGSGQRVRHNRTGRQKGGAVRRLTGRAARPKEDWIELAVPAIVDPALFERAQRQREANRRFPGRKTVEPTLLQGLCVCVHCGCALGRNSGTGGRKTPRLHCCRCQGSEGWRHPEGAVCDNPAVRADELDAAVWTEVPALLENPDLVQGEITRRLEAANDTKDVRQRTDSLQGELARITTRMRRLLDACQEEVMTLEELRERKIPLQARQRAIQSELRALKAAELDRGARLSLAETTERFLGRLRTGAKSVSLAERQRIVRLLVREVRVGKDEVTICHSVPVPTSPPQGSGPSGNDAGKGQLLDSRCRNVVQDQRVPALQVPVGQAPLDPRLALQQPVEHVEHLVAGDGAEPEQGPEAAGRGLRVQRPGGRQLRCGVEDPRGDGGEREVPAPLLPAPEDAPEAEPLHRPQHRRRMAVGQGPADGDGPPRVVEHDPSLEHSAEPLDDGGIEIREVGDGAVAHAPSLAPCPSEEDGRGSVLVRDHVDADGRPSSASCFLPSCPLVAVIVRPLQGFPYVRTNPGTGTQPTAESRCVSVRWTKEGADCRLEVTLKPVSGRTRPPSRCLVWPLDSLHCLDCSYNSDVRPCHLSARKDRLGARTQGVEMPRGLATVPVFLSPTYRDCFVRPGIRTDCSPRCSSAESGRVPCNRTTLVENFRPPKETRVPVGEPFPDAPVAGRKSVPFQSGLKGKRANKDPPTSSCFAASPNTACVADGIRKATWLASLAIPSTDTQARSTGRCNRKRRIPK